MTTITLTTEQTQALLCAVNGTLEDYFQEIRKLNSSAEDSFPAYDSMMDTFRQLAGVKALIEAQAPQH